MNTVKTALVGAAGALVVLAIMKRVAPSLHANF